MKPVTKEQHRSSGAPCVIVTPIDAVIDAVRCTHQHPTLTTILRSVFLVTHGSGRAHASLKIAPLPSEPTLR